MKLGVNKVKKVTEPDFSGKFSFGPNCPKSGQNGPTVSQSVRSFAVLRIGSLVFSGFLHEVRGQ